MEIKNKFVVGSAVFYLNRSGGVEMGTVHCLEATIYGRCICMVYFVRCGDSISPFPEDALFATIKEAEDFKEGTAETLRETAEAVTETMWKRSCAASRSARNGTEMN